jgi:hypothetical protein
MTSLINHDYNHYFNDDVMIMISLCFSNDLFFVIIGYLRLKGLLTSRIYFWNNTSNLGKIYSCRTTTTTPFTLKSSNVCDSLFSSSSYSLGYIWQLLSFGLLSLFLTTCQASEIMTSSFLVVRMTGARISLRSPSRMFSLSPVRNLSIVGLPQKEDDENTATTGAAAMIRETSQTTGASLFSPLVICHENSRDFCYF